MQRRQRERGRLAGARLGAAHQVAPGEHGRNGLELDRRGRVVALVAHGAEQRIGQAKLIKRSHMNISLSIEAELCSAADGALAQTASPRG